MRVGGLLTYLPAYREMNFQSVGRAAVSMTF